MTGVRYTPEGHRLCDALECHQKATHTMIWTDGWHCYCEKHATRMANIGLVIGFEAPQSSLREMTDAEKWMPGFVPTPIREVPSGHVVDVYQCARCGGDHKDLLFTKLTNPMDCGGEIYSQWSLCPTLQEPIIMALAEEQKEVQDE